MIITKQAQGTTLIIAIAVLMFCSGCQLLQTPYQHTEPLLPPEEVEYRVIGGTTDGGGDGGEEGEGVREGGGDGRVGEGVREGEESVVGVATRSEVSHYYHQTGP